MYMLEIETGGSGPAFCVLSFVLSKWAGFGQGHHEPIFPLYGIRANKIFTVWAARSSSFEYPSLSSYICLLSLDLTTPRLHAG